MTLLEAVRSAWGFSGLRPRAVVATSLFGNVLVEAEDGVFWRIRPEDLDCRPIAASREEFEALWTSLAFQRDWLMTPVVQMAIASLGPQRPGRCFCLKIPAVLGGAYAEDNIGAMDLVELLAVSGDIARQVVDLPDGASVQVRIID